MILKFSKLRDKVKTPTRSNPSDAGLDVYYCPDHGKYHDVLHPGENKLYQTGCSFEIPHGYCLLVKNRGSMGSKGIIKGAQVIDAGYNGEVFIDLHNISNMDEFIVEGDKIAQLILVPVVHFRLMECDHSELYQDEVMISNRGGDCLGSTGK